MELFQPLLDGDLSKAMGGFMELNRDDLFFDLGFVWGVSDECSRQLFSITHKPGGPKPETFVFPTPTPILADLSYSSDDLLPIYDNDDDNGDDNNDVDVDDDNDDDDVVYENRLQIKYKLRHIYEPFDEDILPWIKLFALVLRFSGLLGLVLLPRGKAEDIDWDPMRLPTDVWHLVVGAEKDGGVYNNDSEIAFTNFTTPLRMIQRSLTDCPADKTSLEIS
jgi:hypothetical protein